MKDAKNCYVAGLAIRLLVAVLFTFPFVYVQLLSGYFLRYSGWVLSVVDLLFMIIPFGTFFLLAIPIRKHYETKFDVSFVQVRNKLMYEIIGAVLVIALSYFLLMTILPYLIK